MDAHVIEQTNPRRMISYNRTDAPWPVADRDVVLLAETTVDVAYRAIAFRTLRD